MHARIDAIYRLSFAIVGDEADARDSTQETFISAWRRIRELRDPARFDAWLQRIAVNAARMTLRARGRRRVREIPSGDVAMPRGDVRSGEARTLGSATCSVPRSPDSRSTSGRSSSCTTSRDTAWPNWPRSSRSRSERSSRGCTRARQAPPGRARGRGSQAMTEPDWDDDRVAARRSMPASTGHAPPSDGTSISRSPATAPSVPGGCGFARSRASRHGVRGPPRGDHRIGLSGTIGAGGRPRGRRWPSAVGPVAVGADAAPPAAGAGTTGRGPRARVRSRRHAALEIRDAGIGRSAIAVRGWFTPPMLVSCGPLRRPSRSARCSPAVPTRSPG